MSITIFQWLIIAICYDLQILTPYVWSIDLSFDSQNKLYQKRGMDMQETQQARIGQFHSQNEINEDIIRVFSRQRQFLECWNIKD